MRTLIKLVLVLACAFAVSMYYKVFTFDNGIINKVDDDKDAIKALAMDEMAYIKLPNDKYYVVYEYEDKNYLIGLSEDDFKIVKAWGKLTTDPQELSYVPLGIGALAIIVIIFFPKRKRK